MTAMRPATRGRANLVMAPDAIRGRASVVDIEPPRVRCAEEQDCREQHEGARHRGHSRCVSELSVEECLLVDVEQRHRVAFAGPPLVITQTRSGCNPVRPM